MSCGSEESDDAEDLHDGQRRLVLIRLGRRIETSYRLLEAFYSSFVAIPHIVSGTRLGIIRAGIAFL